MELPERYLTVRNFPSKYILDVEVLADYGLQRFDKRKLYQLIILVRDSSIEVAGFRNKTWQLLLSYRQRVVLSKVYENPSLQGFRFKIKLGVFFVGMKRRRQEFLEFFDIRKPTQSTLLNDVVCNNPPGAQ